MFWHNFINRFMNILKYQIMNTKVIFFLLFGLAINFTMAQTIDQPVENLDQKLRHRLDRVEKLVDDVMWFQRLNDVAYVDKLFITGPPVANEENPTALGAGNPLKFWTYAFFPKTLDRNSKYPLIVLPHGGVHADFTTYYYHIVRELVVQGYVVVAPEYRGSTGYGDEHFKKIDYGGLEVADALASKNFMVENYGFIDKNRVGIIGWSHGGLIALMNIFEYPEEYKVAFAGVPVSDLVARMGYYPDSYRELFEADYHIGKSAHEDVNEYRRRSPAWNVHKFKDTPLLIHTNTNDEDVHVLEVEHLIKSLKAEGKQFEYEIFNALPGGHSFDRMDTMTAKKIRVKIYKFLAKQLKPAKPVENLEQLQLAGYGF